jgi:hypothetical protein
VRAYRESDSECWLLDATHEPIADPLMENRINLTPGSALKTGLQRHAHLDSEHNDVLGGAVAAGIDNVLKIRLNVCPVVDVE